MLISATVKAVGSVTERSILSGIPYPSQFVVRLTHCMRKKRTACHATFTTKLLDYCICDDWEMAHAVRRFPIIVRLQQRTTHYTTWREVDRWRARLEVVGAPRGRRIDGGLRDYGSRRYGRGRNFVGGRGGSQTRLRRGLG